MSLGCPTGFESLAMPATPRDANAWQFMDSVGHNEEQRRSFAFCSLRGYYHMVRLVK